MQINVQGLGLQLKEKKAQQEKKEPVRLAKETAYEPHEFLDIKLETPWRVGKSSLATKLDPYPHVRSLFLSNDTS